MEKNKDKDHGEKPLSVRLPVELFLELKEYGFNQNKSMNSVIIELLERFFK